MTERTDTEKNSLYGRLREYAREGNVPFHMPGHKRRIHLLDDPYSIDITEISGFDNLHHAEGILKEAQDNAAKWYGASDTYFLVNGSTAGILAAISAFCRRGEMILAARNCHKSVYHAIALRSLQARWIYPLTDRKRGICGSILPSDVEKELKENPGIRTVVVTSPTYDGVCSDIAGISRAAHAYGALLIVDEAHGAHFGMSADLPESAVHLGADAVITSLHKTLPALTQTALLHVCGPGPDRSRIRYYLGVYQTSSPSYVLMASMDECVRFMMSESGKTQMEQYIARLKKAREALKALKHLSLLTGEEPELECFQYDCSRIVISSEKTGCTGAGLFAVLRDEYGIEAEMAAEHYVVFLTSVGNDDTDFEKLVSALFAIDSRYSHIMPEADPGKTADLRADLPGYRMASNPCRMNMGDALECDGSSVRMEQSEGRISQDTVYLYPPGIPLLIPGEEITKDLLEDLARYRSEGFSLEGMADHSGTYIRVTAAQEVRRSPGPVCTGKEKR